MAAARMRARIAALRDWLTIQYILLTYRAADVLRAASLGERR